MTKISSLSPLSTLSLIGLSSLLLACGGGSGSGSSGKNTSTASSSSAVAVSSVASSASSVSSAVSSSSSSVAANPTFGPVTGLYDVSTTSGGVTDENYLYIDGQGKITAYNYLGDAVDLGNNCYRVATANDFNYKINGKTLTHNASAQTFTVDVDGENLVWKITNNAISGFQYSFISSGTGISMSSANLKLRVTNTRVEAPSIDDIRNSLCQ